MAQQSAHRRALDPQFRRLHGRRQLLRHRLQGLLLQSRFLCLLDTFEENGVKGCWYTNGIIATRYPETLRALARLNHEIDGHNWANNIPMTAISARRGARTDPPRFRGRPKGMGRPHNGLDGLGRGRVFQNLRFLADEGSIWNGDFPDDDVPYIVPVKGKKIVVIPINGRPPDFHYWQLPLSPCWPSCR